MITCYLALGIVPYYYRTIRYSSCIKKQKFISGYTASDVGVGKSGKIGS